MYRCYSNIHSVVLHPRSSDCAETVCVVGRGGQDLEGKIIVDEQRQEVISSNSKAEPPQCTSLAWSADGQVCLALTTSEHPKSQSSYVDLGVEKYLVNFCPFCLPPSPLLIITIHLKPLMFTGDTPANMRGRRSINLL